MDILRRRDFTGIKRTWLHCWYAYIDAYSKTLGLDLGPAYVGIDEKEILGNQSLLSYRLENYRKLCIGEFLRISFDEYLAKPRDVIIEYDAACTRWSSDPDIAARAAAAKLGIR